MKKLPDIYKSVVHTNPNQSTFYSHSFHVEEVSEEENVDVSSVSTTQDKFSVIQEIFKNKNYSYTKKVRVLVAGKTFETRFVQENHGRILTIDNEIIDVDKIDSIEII